MNTHDTDKNEAIEKLMEEDDEMDLISYNEYKATYSDETKRRIKTAKEIFAKLYDGTRDKLEVWDEVWDEVEKLENKRQENKAKAA